MLTKRRSFSRVYVFVVLSVPRLYRGNWVGKVHQNGDCAFWFLAVRRQPHKSWCPPREEEERGKNFKSILSLVIKTKLVQNVNRMSESQKHRPTGRQTDRYKTERLFSLVIKIKVVKTGCQKDRKTDWQTDRQTDRKTFQLSYQNKSC